MPLALLDGQMLHIPFEEMASTSRRHHTALAAQLRQLMGEINALSSRGPGAPLEPESGGVSAAAAREAVSRLVRQIQTIKRNVGEGRRLETAGITKCRARVSALLAHDKTIQLSKSTASRASTDENASPAAASTLAVGDGDAVALASQCDRMIADYLVRTGRSRSVAMLCRSFVASQYASDEPAAATSALTAACTDCAWPAVGWAGTLPHTPTFAEVTKGLALPRGQPSVPTVALASTSTTHATSKVAGLAGDTHVRGDGDTAAIVVADRTLAAAASGPEEGCCAGDGSIACLLDRAPFAACQRISRQLQAGNAVLALEWCESERSRLRKIKSDLEPRLHLQYFLELVASAKRTEAVTYARAHLQPDTLPSEVAAYTRCAMALLALGPDTNVAAPASLLASSRWDDSAAAFSKTFLRLAGAPAVPSLSIALAAGVIALRTPLCTTPDQRSASCPTCSNALRHIAVQLPTCQRSRTVLTCRITSLPIDEANPPYVTPAGHVYSHAALKLLEEENADGGTFVDPETHKPIQIRLLRRAYFV